MHERVFREAVSRRFTFPHSHPHLSDLDGSGSETAWLLGQESQSVRLALGLDQSDGRGRLSTLPPIQLLLQL
jgi:hypothetical protein